MAHGILAPSSGIEPSLPELEGEVLTPGPWRKSLHISYINVFLWELLPAEVYNIQMWQYFVFSFCIYTYRVLYLGIG